MKTATKPLDKACSDYIKEILVFNNETKSYVIPSNLDLSELPMGIIDQFLDHVKLICSNPEEEAIFYGMIKDGTIQVVCDED